MVGWTGETGLNRLARLSDDENLPPVRSVGANDSETMGPQLIKTLMTLFREVPAADLGILTDRPDALGLQYRARTDLYRSEEHTSELQSLMRISYAVFCLKTKTNTHK